MDKVLQALLMTDYAAYCAYVHHGQWKPSAFHKYLCHTVQNFLEKDTGNAYDILVISTAPQHGKSITITETLPSWYLGRNPEKRVIEISYSEDFAKRFGRRNKQKIEEFGNDIFGIQIGDPNTNLDFELKGTTGGMISRGVLSGVTGKSADLMIIDDPIKNREEADSETTRDKIWDEWQNSFKSRFQSHSKVILIMTRWHEDDLAGRIIANEENVSVINLPLEAEENDPLGRRVGEALCPEIGKDDEWLADFKKGFMSKEGSRAWNALFQGHPTGLEGNLFKREWWQYYDELPEISYWCMSVDAAFKDGEDNDFVAIQVWGKTRANMYLVDRVKAHLNLPDTIREIVRLRNMYPMCKTTLIEDKANGSAIINILRKELTGIIAVNPKGGKVARANAIVGAVESGNVYLPSKKRWIGEYIEEFAAFPNGVHDDECFVAGTKVATPLGDRNIEDIKVGDRVITPFGIRKVIDSFCVGERDTVKFEGIEGTPDHKFYYDGHFVEMDSLTQALKCSKLTLKGVLKWKYLKALFSTESNTDLWGRESIIFLNQLATKVEKEQRGFMWLFGNTTADRKYLKAIKFIISMAILSITTSATLSVYHLANIVRGIKNRLLSITSHRNNSTILTESDRSQKSGMRQKKAENGIKTIMKSLSAKFSRKNIPVYSAVRNSWQDRKTQNSVHTTANQSTIGEIRHGQKQESASFAEKNLKQSSMNLAQRKIKKEHRLVAEVAEENSYTETEKKKVYNITVEKDHLFYAGGFLVSNCDSTSQALNHMIYSKSEIKGKTPTDIMEKFFPNYKPKKKYSVGRGSQIRRV